MTTNNFINLIHKKLRGQLSAKDTKALDTWKQASDDNKSLAQDVEKIWQASSSYKKDYQPDVEQGLSRFKASMQQEETNTKVVSMPRRTWLSRVAAAVLVLAVAGIAWQYSQSSPDLILAETVLGETKLIELADGSTITLNENSALSYPAAFDSKQRHVYLQGEAFFDIHRNPEKPFRVETDYTNIQVLGTSFNVRALIEESTTEVAVATGKVQLKEKDSEQALVLQKTDKGVFNQKSKVLRKIETPSNNATSWMNQKLAFRKMPLAMALQDLERHFNVEIELENSQLENCAYTSLFNEPKLDKILNSLSGSFHFELIKTSATSYQLQGGRCN